MTALQRFNRIWPPIATLVVALVITEVAVRRNWVASFLVPTPTDAAKSLFQPVFDACAAARRSTRKATPR